MDKIFIDASLSAVLLMGTRSVERLTIQEACIEWHRLPADIQKQTRLNTPAGQFTGDEIGNLYYA